MSEEVSPKQKAALGLLFIAIGIVLFLFAFSQYPTVAFFPLSFILSLLFCLLVAIAIMAIVAWFVKKVC